MGTGQVAVTLTKPIDRDLTPFVGLYGQQPLIYHFEGNTLTFVTFSGLQQRPFNNETALFDTVDWNIASETFSDNCYYTHLTQDTLDATGEIIEVKFDLSYVYYSTLQLVLSDDAISYKRQIILETTDFQIMGVTFIQNGERIVVWGLAPEAEQYTIFIIERNGTMIDQLDVPAVPRIQGTSDGFVYTYLIDYADWVTEINYVNTREATHNVIWQSDPNEYFYPVWADMYDEISTADYLPWANLGTIETSDCPTNRG